MNCYLTNLNVFIEVTLLSINNDNYIYMHNPTIKCLQLVNIIFLIASIAFKFHIESERLVNKASHIFIPFPNKSHVITKLAYIYIYK